MTFGDRLCTARKTKGMTQQQLASIIGCAKSTLTGYEKGNREPDVFKIKRIIEVLECDSSWLLGVEDALNQGSGITKKPPPSEDESDTYIGLTHEAVVVAARYDDAELKDKNIVRVTLGLGLLESDTEEPPKKAGELKTG